MSILSRPRSRNSQFWLFVKFAVMRINQIHMPVTSLTRPLFAGLYVLHVSIREGLIRLFRFLWFEPLFRSQCERVGPRFQMEQLPYITGNGRIVVGSDVRLSGKSSIGFASHTSNKPALIIGDFTFIGHNCTFLVGQSVTIGKHCLLAGGVRVSDFDGHPIDAAQRRNNQPFSSESIRPVSIGDDVWIGSGTHVLKGVRIGDRSIIGAGSMVTNDVPADVVAAGNPARVVKALAQ